MAISNPIMEAGSASAKPASGPAMPMSKSARRVVIGSLILMTAPNVPNRVKIGGAGIKKGSVAFIP